MLQNIKPSTQEIKKLKTLVDSFLKKIKIKDAEIILGGSGAKDTWLKGSHDIDIFVRYDYKKYKDKSDELSKLLEEKIHKAFPKKKITKLHGSRDYFQINYENVIFEIVPMLKITKSSEAVNITDISPLHALWVKKNVKNKDEVLLAKQFCKAQELYGAESYLSSFSGYVLEILIGHYGTFEKLLKASLKWKLQEIIDPSKFYKKKMALFHLNKSKLGPLIVVDPVDNTRNAAAALSEEKFQLFRKKAKEYLNNKSDKFFVKNEINPDKLRKEQGNLVYLEITPLTGKRDVVGAKLLKVFNFFKKELNAFGLKKSIWKWDKMYFIVNKKELASEKIRKGPPLKIKEQVKNFKKKNKDTYVKSGNIYAKIKVQNPKLNDFVKNLLKDEYVKEKIKKIKN